MRELSPTGKRLLLLTLPALALLNFFIWRAALAPRALAVSVLVAGKGNAVLLRAGRRAVLIDGGADASILRALGAALPPWRRELDAIILTAPLAREAGGIPEVLARYRVRAFLRARMRGSPAAERALAAPLAKRGLSTTFLERGTRLVLGERARIDVLWPPPTPAAMKPNNGGGLVLLLSSGAQSVLIDKEPAARAAAWRAQLDAGTPAPSFTITASSSAAIFSLPF